MSNSKQTGDNSSTSSNYVTPVAIGTGVLVVGGLLAVALANGLAKSAGHDVAANMAR